MPDDPIIVTRALSLTQPWATLVAIGAKSYETRSWKTPYRGWVAIHASKGFPRDCQMLCMEHPFAAHLPRAGYSVADDLPRGQVLAVALLQDCLSTNFWTPSHRSDEYALGDYGEDRYAWHFSQVRALKEPFACKGALGIWKLPRALIDADLA